jgi:protein-S-isoprenylcysteine O-methyltransferase Ste14
MRPLPFTNLGAGIAFVVVIIIFAVVQLDSGRGTLRGGGWRPGRSDRFDRGSLLVVIVSGGVGVALSAIFATKLEFATIAASNPAVRWVVFVVGLAAIVGGSALREWAVRTLGASFTFDVRVAADQRVVTGGPYRFLRHPSYTGLIASYVGLGLTFGNWLSLAVIAILPTAGLVYRIRVEESALREKLGAAYAQFASGRKRIIPGIW